MTLEKHSNYKSRLAKPTNSAIEFAFVDLYIEIEKFSLYGNKRIQLSDRVLFEGIKLLTRMISSDMIQF